MLNSNNTNIPCCGQCRAYVAWEKNEEGETIGQCRRHAPTVRVGQGALEQAATLFKKGAWGEDPADEETAAFWSETIAVFPIVAALSLGCLDFIPD
jgi:hypothetical protein